MSRPLRIKFEGGVYHVTARGNARSDIYLSDEDREMFLAVLAYVVDRFAWVCPAYCLMDNHYHLMIETPQANLSRGMGQLNGMYTQRYNRAHQRVGHVFQGRFKSIVVDKESYLLELSRYVVLNPVRAGMVEGAGDWIWSSYRATIGESVCPKFIDTRFLLAHFGKTKSKARLSYVDFVRDGISSKPWDMLNGPDILGDDDFRSALQSQVKGHDIDISKRKQVLRHLPLVEIAGGDRGAWMREAYCEHGYTMQAIAEFAGLHHSTVSRLIKGEDSNARNKG